MWELRTRTEQTFCGEEGGAADPCAAYTHTHVHGGTARSGPGPIHRVTERRRTASP